MPAIGPNVDLSDKKTSDIEYKIAATREERASAFRLVYRSYLEVGLGEPNPYEMRVTPYHLLPTTEVFLATLAGETVFTLSLVADGKLGLPMESVYGSEVETRRAQGVRLAEASCLADRRSQFRGFFPVFLRLCRLMAQYARREGIEELLIAVHPKHAKFYRRFIGFRAMGQPKAYPTVRNHPAVALCLNFAQLDRERPHSYDTFFGQPIHEEVLHPQPITAADCDYFSRMIDARFVPAPLSSSDEPSSSSGEAAVATV
ncbi:MAG: N-acyl amino acid synthase FeeM domain-containing protein [Planctomycetota bacterium]|jgi:hypothetical protein